MAPALKILPSFTVRAARKTVGAITFVKCELDAFWAPGLLRKVSGFGPLKELKIRGFLSTASTRATFKRIEVNKDQRIAYLFLLKTLDQDMSA